MLLTPLAGPHEEGGRGYLSDLVDPAAATAHMHASVAGEE